MMATRATSQITAAKASFAGKAVRGSVSTKAAAVSTKVVCAAAKSWMPGSKHPAHLNGSLVGDFGFDPLGLGKKPQDLAWYVQAELVHARFAMLGAAGIMIPEALTKMGVLNTPHWYDAGAMDIGWTNFTTLAFAQFVMMGFAEHKRIYNFKFPGKTNEAGWGGLEAGIPTNGDVNYPGEAFDPLGFSKDPAVLAKMKLREIKNGRLAMLAVMGFFNQSAATKTGPIDNLLDHIADPFHTCVTSNPEAIPFL